jgi:hypothetical protein
MATITLRETRFFRLETDTEHVRYEWNGLSTERLAAKEVDHDAYTQTLAGFAIDEGIGLKNTLDPIISGVSIVYSKMIDVEVLELSNG